MKSRVLQIVTQLERAGAQTVAKWMEGDLRERDFQVTTRFLYKKFDSDLFPDKACILESRPGRIADVIEILRGLSNEAEKRPDVILAHTHYAMMSALLIKMRSPSSRMVFVHHWPIGRYPLVVRAALKIARLARAISVEVSVADGLGVPNAVVIPNPIPDMGNARLNEADENVDVLVVARHSREKGLDTALHALQHATDRTITFAGGGALTEQLKQLACELGVDDRAFFVGSCERERVYEMMRAARVVLLPSRWEAMPMVLLEAVAADADIVASNIEAHRFLERSSAALLFKVDDAVDLAQCLQMLQDDEPRRLKLSQGRNRLRALQSEESIGSRWEHELIRVATCER